MEDLKEKIIEIIRGEFLLPNRRLAALKADKIISLMGNSAPVAKLHCSDGLNAELVNAIEQMAVEINLAPDDNPCITMHPRIWLLWERILDKAGIAPNTRGI